MVMTYVSRIMVGLLCLVTTLSASVFTPINITYNVTQSTRAFIGLILLLFIEVIWLRLIAKSHILKVMVVAGLMNVASLAITTWGPYFIFENIITGSFTRYMVYVNVKDFMASPYALLHGILIVGIWILINVAVEAMVVGLFYHTINKRSLFILLVTVHLMSVGAALYPEFIKKVQSKEVKRATPKNLAKGKDA